MLNFEHTLHESECLDFISSETHRLIDQLKVKKASSPDRIPNVAVNQSPNHILNHIIQILNSALKLLIEYAPRYLDVILGHRLKWRQHVKH